MKDQNGFFEVAGGLGVWRVNAVRLYRQVGAGAGGMIIFCADIAALLLSFNLAFFLRVNLLAPAYSRFHGDFPLPFGGFLDVWWIFPVWIFFLLYEGVYTKRFSFWDEVLTLWKVSFFSTVGIFTLASMVKMSDQISRTVIILMGLVSFLFLPLVKMVTKKILRKLGFLERNVLILGAGATGKLIASALTKEPNYGYRVVGFLDDDPAKVGTSIDGVKVHRGVEKVCSYVRSCGVSDLFIAMPGAGNDKVQRLVDSLQHKVDRVLFVPDVFGMAVLGTSLRHFFHEQAFALEIKNNLAMPLNIVAKRCFDLSFSILLLPVLSLPMAMIALCIRLSSKGPAIFSQERMGRKGRPFRCYKFRTMYADAEKKLAELLDEDFLAKEEWCRHRKLRDDPRVTGVGEFLRATSLDELPQIFNVLRGEMSLVGPRPVTREEIELYYKDAADLCFIVLPGITGLWQVSGRSNTSYEYRIGLDSWYVKNWNVWLDIVILLKTIRVVLKREGAC